MKQPRTPVLKAGRPTDNKERLPTLSSLNMHGEKETKRINFDVTAGEHMQLKIFAAQRGQTIAEFFREYMAQVLSVRA